MEKKTHALPFIVNNIVDEYVFVIVSFGETPPVVFFTLSGPFDSNDRRSLDCESAG